MCAPVHYHAVMNGCIVETNKAIVLNSPRRDAAFLKINCGALPETLLESELFGHVQGSFTGATANKIGKFGTERIGDVTIRGKVTSWNCRVLN